MGVSAEPGRDHLPMSALPAWILAGGLGTRLRDVVGDELPKSLVEVDGRPFVDHLLAWLAAQGCRDVCLLTGHGADALVDHVGDGSRWGLAVSYSREREPLGTGGALRHALPLLRGPRTLVLNGDSFVDVALEHLVRSHLEARGARGVLATLVLVRVEDTSRFGSVTLAGDGTIAAFREKSAARGAGFVSAGIYLVEGELIERIPAGRPVSLEREVWPVLLDGRLLGLPVERPFTDLGTPESLQALRADPALLRPPIADPRRGTG